jgi:oxygen-independent coproporphyrinogen-3 oxidase
VKPNNPLPESLYLEKLIEDLNQDLAWAQNRSLHSIFIGGGTPSLLSGTFYHQLLAAIQKAIPFVSNIEVTLEANPGTVEQSRFEAYREAGINRLSLGIQSFNTTHLVQLGRIHNAQEAIKAVKLAQKCQFERINIDLMYGLPHQSLSEALDDIQKGIDLGTTHLSWYQLTIEPNTEFFSRPPILPEDDDLFEIHSAGHQQLQSAGFRQYEVSAWAKPGQASRHNLNYWQFGDYLAIGAGAHGKISFLNSPPLRFQKTRQPDAYLKRINHFFASRLPIPEDEIAFEFLMNALRLKDGVEENLFTERTGLSIDHISTALNAARQQQLLVPKRLQATQSGFNHLNTLLDKFL